MPIMFLSAAEGTFDQAAKDAIAEQLTDLGAECERLARTDFVRSTTYLHFCDLPAGDIFHGGKRATAKIATLLVNALEGGFHPGPLAVEHREPRGVTVLTPHHLILTEHALENETEALGGAL